MNTFVIQRHEADRAGHHQDFRLEIDGTLASWAVPKDLPLDKGIKRLAIKVSDHPLSYANFSGIIESGYGKGIVGIEDEGYYEPVSIQPNSILIRLVGKTYKGIYRIKHWEGSKWLFWKSD